MKILTSTTLLILLSIYLISCNEATKKKDEHIKKEKEIIILGDNSQQVSYYYPNGQLKETGIIKDSLKIGIWKEWYADNQVKWEGSYDKKGERIIEVRQQTPVIKFKNNSMPKVGIPVAVKIMVNGLHPKDAVYATNNGTMRICLDDPSYDMYLIPEKTGKYELSVYALAFQNDYFIGRITFDVK